MILVIGAAASGKRAYVEALGYGPADIADGVLDRRPVLVNLQELVKADPARAEALLPALLGKAAVTCDQVGAGVIPAEAFEREWREAVGRLCILLAQRAEKVVRCVCGVPQLIKGEEPWK